MEKRPDLPIPLFRYLLFSFIFVAGGVITGCTTSPPRILDLFQQLDVVREDNSGTQYEELTLFLMVEDDDGRNDIEELVLTHPESELQWRLTVSDWREIERNDELWIGGGGFRMPEGRRPPAAGGLNSEEPALPRGSYLVELVDRAGEKTESEFILPEDISGLRNGIVREELFPRFEGKSSFRLVGETGGQVSVLLLTGEGKFLKSETLPVGPVNQKHLEEWKKLGAVSFRLHRYLEDRGFGLVNGPFSLP